jgi:hypothetical protein
MIQFEIFREIFVGGLTKVQLIQKLVDKGIQFNSYANILFDHPQFVPSKNIQKVKLVKASLCELGLSENCSLKEFENQIFSLELKLCPLYLAAFLRLDYLDQEIGPYLTIASKKVESSENYPNGFYIRNFEKTLWLRGYRADGFADWPDRNEFILLK